MWAQVSRACMWISFSGRAGVVGSNSVVNLRYQRLIYSKRNNTKAH